jgi:hypothetical protein
MAKETVSMTNRQRMKALLQRQKPDRVPMWSLALAFNTLYSKGSVAELLWQSVYYSVQLVCVEWFHGCEVHQGTVQEEG